jgi:hypothetical protein
LKTTSRKNGATWRAHKITFFLKIADIIPLHLILSSLIPNQALLYSCGKFTDAKGQPHKMSLVPGQGTWNLK